MDTSNAKPRFLRWLPFIAVFQTDLRQTPRNWVWRMWVAASLGAAFCYLIYRFGVYREGGILQSASRVFSDLLHWIVLGSLTLIVVFTAGAISADRGTLADSVLSRGISRCQYFLAKLSARMVSVLCTYFALCILVLIGCHFLLHDQLSLDSTDAITTNRPSSMSATPSAPA